MGTATTRVHERYRLRSMLGRGGQSRVYLATDERGGGGPVVVKSMICRGCTDEARREELELFLQEGRILAEVDHPSLPRLIESFSEGDSHYVVEERVGEVSLETVLRERADPLSQEEVAWLGHQMLDLLTHLHNLRRSVVLRDIKPANITCWLDRDGRIRRDRPIYFVDLTIAVHYSPTAEDAVRMGSPGYAPPEQYRGRSQPRSDLYALGVTMFAALSGHDPCQTPFHMPSLGSLRPDLPSGWEGFFERAMALEPGRRFQSAREMHQALSALMPAERCAEPLPPPRRGAASLRRVALALSLALLALLILLVVRMGLRVDDAPPHPKSSRSWGTHAVPPVLEP